MNDLQGLVDAMASELGRPIGVDDSRFRLLAHSAHQGSVDSVRLTKLLRREANPRVVEWLEGHGVREARDFSRVPPCEELEMAARIIVPLRFDGELLGFLALIDEPQPFSERELIGALRYTDDLGLALFRQRRLRREKRDPRTARARAALGLAAAEEEPAEDVTPAPLLPPASLYACLVARAVGPSVEAAPPGWALASLAAALERACHTVLPQHAIALIEDEMAIGAFAAGGTEEIEALARRIGDDLEARLADYPQWRGAIGIGAPVADLAGLRGSFEQARHAAFLAATERDHGPLARWPELGADGTISSLLDGADPETLVPEPLQRLLEHPDAAVLLETVESYLDSGGDTGASAAALYVHRTSLYHRLRRVEEITGVDLSSGDGRLELHLGIRLLRMAGADSTSVASRA